MSSQQNSNMSMEPPMCANGCGFYGSVQNKNMCSKCYMDHIKKQGNNITTGTATKPFSIFPWANEHLNSGAFASGISLPSSHNSVSDNGWESSIFGGGICSPSLSASDASVSEINSSKSNNTGSNKNRCESCNKKVGVLGFPCRCGGVFCGMHRYPEEHSCGVDRKKAGRDILAKQNPLIKGEKLKWKI